MKGTSLSMDEETKFEPLDDQNQPAGADEEAPESFVPSADELTEMGAEEEDVRPFVPTDYYEPKRGHKRRGAKKRRRGSRALWAILIALGVILLAVAGVTAYRIVYAPEALFSGDAPALATPSPAAEAQRVEAGQTPVPSLTPSPTPLSEYDAMALSADQSMMQNIVNVMVIGVDYAEERETWNGKHAYHSDVMMILAINFDEKRVDLISLPRDTYANIPGVKGIYKLNASLNCGGGFEAADGAGFLKTCEAASFMIGGIPVNYYYAVTMPAVKELVDVVGGVDYDLEMSFKMAGRSYKKGPQHLDGQGVLDYLRVRKNVAESGDLNRINRQKQMMVALFETMQQQDLITKIPQIVSSFSGQLFTNCTAAQTAALATFAYNLDKENIGMYSMSGTMKNIFNWNFCITDQSNRVKIVKTVYGVDVPEAREYGMDYAQYRWAAMRAERYLDVCEPLTEYLDAAIRADDLLPAAPEYIYPDGGDGSAVIPEIAPPTGDLDDAPMGWSGGGFTVRPLLAVRPVEGEIYQQYGVEARSVYAAYKSAYESLEDALATANAKAAAYVAGETDSLGGAGSALAAVVDDVYNYGSQAVTLFGYGSVGWTINYEKDPDINEIYVDFR